MVEYYHRGVIFHLVGFPMALPLDVEMIRPGEDEVAAARRLLERVWKPYGRFFDVILGDARYFEAPFINFCTAHGKEVMAVLKDERRVLFQDAQGLFSQMKPQRWQEGPWKIRAWDAEGFSSAEGVQVPLRVLHTEEIQTVRQRQDNRWMEKTETHSWWWVTTVPFSRLSTRLFWKIGHSRWEIENNLFHSLSTYWSLDHCFHHEPTAILNFILTLFIAFVLLQSFYHGNLKPQRRKYLTLIALARELYLGVATLTSPAPWLDRGG